MIFKYFAYDKKTKDWLDTKSYCTICMPANVTKASHLTSLFYKTLTAQKLISIPSEYFSLSDSSNFPGIKTFTLSHLTPSKRTNIGRLTQLPDRENAANNAKIKESWSSTLAFAIPKVRPADPGGMWIGGGWDNGLIVATQAPRRATRQYTNLYTNALREPANQAIINEQPILPVEAVQEVAIAQDQPAVAPRPPQYWNDDPFIEDIFLD